MFEVTEGRGIDVALEIVGQSPALRLAFDILRPWGVISSIGVHYGEVCESPWIEVDYWGSFILIMSH